jgi:uncharacterized protein (TIGR00369 family)
MDETFTTVELKINYLKPIWNEKLTASAKVMKKGKSIGFVTCDVVDEKGNLVVMQQAHVCLFEEKILKEDSSRSP